MGTHRAKASGRKGVRKGRKIGHGGVGRRKKYVLGRTEGGGNWEKGRMEERRKGRMEGGRI